MHHMFKLIAILFAIVNGAPSDKPAGALAYKAEMFPTEEACVAFVKSDEGMAVIQTVAKMAAEREMAIRVACIKDAKSQEQDDSL